MISNSLDQQFGLMPRPLEFLAARHSAQRIVLKALDLKIAEEPPLGVDAGYKNSLSQFTRTLSGSGPWICKATSSRG